MRKENIKCVSKILFVVLTICICNYQVYALDVMGPPAAELEEGRVDFGIDYSYTDMDVDLHNGSYTDYFNGALYDWGDALDVKLKDININKAYARFGYGLTDSAEIFIRLGGMNTKFEDAIWEDSEDFDSDVELAAGAGVKMTIYEEDNFKLGGLFQFSSATIDGQLESPNWLTSDYVEMNMTEVQVALGASCRCNENLTVYGGPFLHFVSGNIKDNMNQYSSDPAGQFTSEFEWDVEQRSVLGGYIGAQINVSEQCFLNFEYQQTSDASAFGMGMIFNF